MRSCTVNCAVVNTDKIRVKRSGIFVNVQRLYQGRSLNECRSPVCLRPERARKLAKALNEMADEIKKEKGKK